MADIQVQKAKLADAQRIADFVNESNPRTPVSRQEVMMRFGQVGFLIAYEGDELVGMAGWQVENLIIQVTDYLVSTKVDRDAVGSAFTGAMEEQGLELQAEASILCLPSSPSDDLIAYWEQFKYAYQDVASMYRAWRDAIKEWAPETEKAMVKSLRSNVVMRPM